MGYQDNIIELTKHPLSKDGKFRFRCDMCGDCCKGRDDDILLNAHDIYRMSKALGMKPADVLKEHAAMYMGKDSMLPLAAIKMKDGGRCPFLMEDNRCRIQDGKPTVCALYPLGRFSSIDKSSGKTETGYFLQPVCCGKKDRTQTSRGWMGEFGLEEGEEFFVLWNEAVAGISTLLRRLLPRLGEDMRQVLLNVASHGLYIEYDTEKPLLPQVAHNTDMVIDTLKAVEGLLGNNNMDETKEGESSWGK